MAAPRRVQCRFVDESDGDSDVKSVIKVEPQPRPVVEIIDHGDEIRPSCPVEVEPKLFIDISDDDDNLPLGASHKQQHSSTLR